MRKYFRQGAQPEAKPVERGIEEKREEERACKMVKTKTCRVRDFRFSSRAWKKRECTPSAPAAFSAFKGFALFKTVAGVQSKAEQVHLPCCVCVFLFSIFFLGFCKSKHGLVPASAAEL